MSLLVTTDCPDKPGTACFGRKGDGVTRLRKVLILFLIAAGAISAMGADSCSDVSKDLDKADKAEKQAKVNWGQVHVGDSKAAVKSALGPPSSTQNMENSYGSSSCWYWGTGAYQVCFDENSEADSKNRY